MKCNEHGVDEQSDYYFFTPNSNTKPLFYHALCVGEFFCCSPYEVVRNHYNSYLYIQVVSGSLDLVSEGVLLNAGDAFIMDCYKPHHYLTTENVHFRFAHIDGLNTGEFFERMRNSSRQMHPYSHLSNNVMKALIEHYRDNQLIVDGHVSMLLHQLLIYMINDSGSVLSTNNYSQPIDQSIKFIHDNLSKAITIGDMSKIASLSPFHFSRRFKQEVHQSPYDYLIQKRIDHAKTLLKSSEKSIEEIAYDCGFNHLSGFSSAFKKITSTTPSKFRQMPL